MPSLELSLRFFDLVVSVNTDSNFFRNVIERMYQRFENSDLCHSQRISICNKREIQLAVEGETSRVSAFDVSRLASLFSASIRTHLLIHAGVLSHGGQGILIVAPSMHGKTTLTLELLRRGFDFLSDEVAAVGLKDALVHPFPRSLVIRSGSLALAGFPPLPSDTPTWLGKQIVDAEVLRPGCMGEAVPIRHIFFLHDGSQNEPTLEQPAQPAEIPSCGLLLSSLTPELLSTIRSLDGMDTVTVGEMEGQPYLTVYAQDRPTVLKEIDALCLEHHVDLLHLGYRPLHRPDFTGPVELTKLPQSNAVMYLLQQFLGGYHSALLQDDLGNSPVRLSMTLARMIREADCYQLNVGPLQEMADSICSVIRDS